MSFPNNNNNTYDDYSCSSTVTIFPYPLPLVRKPYSLSLLAFPSSSSFFTSLQSSYTNLLSQCHSGARIACALNASKICQPPFWNSLFGFVHDLSQRHKCEEIETQACFVLAKQKCTAFAKDKCLKGFSDARVLQKDGTICRGRHLISSDFWDLF